MVIQALLGLIYLVFGLNGLLMGFGMAFITLPPPTGKAATFMGGLMAAPYFFPVLKITEIVSGALLLSRFYTPLALVLLAPITLQIFLFHVVLAPAGLPMAIGMLLFHVFLGYAYRSYYAGLFTAKAHGAAG